MNIMDKYTPLAYTLGVDIEERLDGIAVAQAEALVVLRGLDERVGKIDRVLRGDGNGMKGHNVRLDRLEQAANGVRRLFYVLLVPVALLVVKAVAGVLGTPEV